jgi:hypothetical protein
VAEATGAIVNSQATGRSPAEKAFDFLMFPSLLNAALLVAAFVTNMVDSGGGDSVTAPPSVVNSLHAGAILSLLHWLMGFRKVVQAWHDPFGKVLRFSSAVILAMQALVIAEAFGLRVIVRLVTFLID